MKDFFELTVRGQALRLRHLAHVALGHYDIEVARISLLSNAFNGIFRIDTTDGHKAALSINLPGLRSREETRSEMMWLNHVHRDNSVYHIHRHLLAKLALSLNWVYSIFHKMARLAFCFLALIMPRLPSFRIKETVLGLSPLPE